MSFFIFQSAIKKITKISNILLSLLHIDTFKKIQRCDVLLICHDADRGYKHNGEAYASLIDSMGYYFSLKGYSCSSIATPFSRLVGKRAFGHPVSLNWIYLIFVLKVKICKKFLTDYVELCEKKYVGIWFTILQISQPKVVIAIQPNIFICRAARSFGVPVYDLQHGAISSDHLWYGKKLFNYKDDGDLPSGFLCWDKHSGNFIKSWAVQRNCEIFIIGNPWFKRFYDANHTDVLVHNAMKKFLTARNDKPNILVSLQWNMSENLGIYTTNGVIPDCLEAVISHTADKFNWNIRMHPVQLLGSEYFNVISYLEGKFKNYDNVEWRNTSMMPLPLLLSFTDMHITCWSTVTIEAGWFGIRTGLLDTEMVEGGKRVNFFSNEKSIGLATVLPLDELQIENWIFSDDGKGSVNSVFFEDFGLTFFIDTIFNTKTDNIYR